MGLRSKSLKPTKVDVDFRRKKVKVGRKVKKGNETKINVKAKQIQMPTQNLEKSNPENDMAMVEKLKRELAHHNHIARNMCLLNIKAFFKSHPNPELFTSLIFPNMLELLFDEEKDVRKTLLDVFTEFFDMFSSDVLLSTSSVMITYISSGLTSLVRGMRRDAVKMLYQFSLKHSSCFDDDHAYTFLTHLLSIFTETMKSTTSSDTSLLTQNHTTQSSTTTKNIKFADNILIIIMQTMTTFLSRISHSYKSSTANTMEIQNNFRNHYKIGENTYALSTRSIRRQSLLFTTQKRFHSQEKDQSYSIIISISKQLMILWQYIIEDHIVLNTISVNTLLEMILCIRPLIILHDHRQDSLMSKALLQCLLGGFPYQASDPTMMTSSSNHSIPSPLPSTASPNTTINTTSTTTVLQDSVEKLNMMIAEIVLQRMDTTTTMATTSLITRSSTIHSNDMSFLIQISSYLNEILSHEISQSLIEEESTIAIQTSLNMSMTSTTKTTTTTAMNTSKNTLESSSPIQHSKIKEWKKQSTKMSHMDLIKRLFICVTLFFRTPLNSDSDSDSDNLRSSNISKSDHNLERNTTLITIKKSIMTSMMTFINQHYGTQSSPFSSSSDPSKRYGVQLSKRDYIIFIALFDFSNALLSQPIDTCDVDSMIFLHTMLTNITVYITQLYIEFSNHEIIYKLLSLLRTLLLLPICTSSITSTDSCTPATAESVSSSSLYYNQLYQLTQWIFSYNNRVHLSSPDHSHMDQLKETCLKLWYYLPFPIDSTLNQDYLIKWIDVIFKSSILHPGIIETFLSIFIDKTQDLDLNSFADIVLYVQQSHNHHLSEELIDSLEGGRIIYEDEEDQYLDKKAKDLKERRKRVLDCLYMIKFHDISPRIGEIICTKTTNNIEIIYEEVICFHQKMMMENVSMMTERQSKYDEDDEEDDKSYQDERKALLSVQKDILHYLTHRVNINLLLPSIQSFSMNQYSSMNIDYIINDTTDSNDMKMDDTITNMESNSPLIPVMTSTLDITVTNILNTIHTYISSILSIHILHDSQINIISNTKVSPIQAIILSYVYTLLTTSLPYLSKSDFTIIDHHSNNIKSYWLFHLYVMYLQSVLSSSMTADNMSNEGTKNLLVGFLLFMKYTLLVSDHASTGQDMIIYSRDEVCKLLDIITYLSPDHVDECIRYKDMLYV